MTHNQIELWKLREDVRSHKAQEAENARSHKATESINTAGVAETVRHNTELEALQNLSLEEAARHNAASEGEAIRSNMENESIKRASNDINLSLGLGQIEASKYGSSLSAAASRYATNMNVAETSRHNQATETYSYFMTNVDRDVAFANVAVRKDELALKEREFGLSQRAQSETERHNLKTEEMQRFRDNNEFKVRTESNQINGLTGIFRAIPLSY